MAQLKSTNITGNLAVTGSVLASKIIKHGGTSNDILLGDGSTITKNELQQDITNDTNTTYSLSKSGSSITLTGSDGSSYSVTDSNDDTTYSFSSGNDGFTVTPTGGSGQSVGVESTRILRLDTRSLNPAPYAENNYAGYTTVHLKTNSAIGITGEDTYSALMQIYPWGDASGGAAHQLVYGTNGGIYHRYGKTSWSSWDRLATRAWVNTQIPSVSGTTGTIPKFTDTNTIGDSSIQETDSKVHIAKRVTLKCTGSSYNEGLRIWPISSGWGNIFFASGDTESGTDGTGWLLGRTGTSFGYVGDFTIQCGNSLSGNGLWLRADGNRPRWNNNELAYLSDVPDLSDAEKVKQEHATDANYYPLLFKSTAGTNNTNTVTESTKFNKQIYIVPSSGTLYGQTLIASDHLHSSGYVSVNSDLDEYREIFPDVFSTDIDTQYYSRGIVLTDCDNDDEYILSYPDKSGILGLQVYHHVVKLSGTISGYYTFVIVLNIYNTTSTKFTLNTLSSYLYNRYGTNLIPCSCQIYSTTGGNTYYHQFYGFYVGSGSYHYITWRTSNDTGNVTNNSNTVNLIRLDKYTGTGIPSNVISLQSETVYAL